MDLKLINGYLKVFEGYKETVYIDSLGNPTVGIGHLIKGDESPYIEPIIGFRINQKQIEELFNNDIKDAVKKAKTIIPNFEQHPSEVQSFLVMMCFNLGYKLKTFKKANKHLINFNYGLARDEYLDSVWCKQVGIRRATHTTNLLRFEIWKL